MKNKKGFALIESIFMIVFISVALLIVYKAFATSFQDEKRRIHYDNTASLYKTYFIKQYFEENDILDYLSTATLTNGYLEINCQTLSSVNSEYCDFIKSNSNFNVKKIYITKYDMAGVSYTNLEPTTIDYFRTLSGTDTTSYRIIIWFNDNEYASLKLGNLFYALNIVLDGGTWNGETPQRIVSGDTVNISNPTKDGYVFAGWNVIGVGSTINSGVFTMGAEDTVLIATWQRPVYQFTYTGNYQTFTAPYTGYYLVELWGAQGGNTTTGYGGYTSGYIYMAKDSNYYLYLGGKGSETIVTNAGGGYNGGGNAGSTGASRAGGGATDIRLVSGVWNDATGLKSRIMVAGGGGAGENNLGGAGGSLMGGANHAGTYATQISGSAFGYATTPTIDASGAGGGYWGGVLPTADGVAAGGGSSFISGYAGSNAIVSSSSTAASNNTMHYSNKYFINGTMQSGVNIGNGKATISYAGESIPEKTNTKLNSVRYIKDCINGSTTNTSNHWVELQAISNGVNVALGKTVTGTGTINASFPLSNAVNGDLTSANYAEITTTGFQCITVDLGQAYNLDEIGVWHYYADGRAYYSNTTYTSSDNSNWTAVIANANAETSQGKKVTAWDSNNTVVPIYRITNMVVNGGFENGSTGWTASNFTMTANSTYKQSGSYSMPILTANSTHAQMTQNVAIVAGNKYYGKVSFLRVGTLDNGGQYDILGFTAGEMDFATSDNTNIPTTSQWYNLSNIVNGIETKTVQLRKYTFSKVAIYTDSFTLINLTSTFGAGKEPSKAWCDANLNYFDGTQNFYLTP